MDRRKENKEICIRFESVTKKIDHGKLVLERADFIVKKNEKIWISGNEYELDCLFELLSGMQHVNEGKIYMPFRCAYVPPYFPALENMTVMDYMILSLKLSGKTGKYAKTESRSFLEDSYFKEKKTMKTEALSDFEKCLLMFYMALCQKPEVLIIGNIHMWLDENEVKKLWEIASKYTDKTMTVLYLAELRNRPNLFEHRYQFEHNQLRMVENEEI